MKPVMTGNLLPLYKQVIGTLTSCLLSVAGGITFGFTSVLLPQLHEDKDFNYDESYDSWIASISPLAMIFGCLCSGSMSDAFGRKMGQIFIIFPYIGSWLIMSFSNGITMILLGRFITGVCTGAIRPTSMVYIGEIVDPKYRAIALFLPSMAVQVGALISHTVGKYFYWRTSCLLFVIPTVMCFISLLFLKESPLWLISKGKYDEGVMAFRLFRGDGEAAEEELKTVLERQKEKSTKVTLRDFLKTIFSRAFMKNLFTIFLLLSASQLCGINTISFYAQDILERTFSGDVDAYKLMLITDGIRIITAGAVCLLAQKLPRRVFFLVNVNTTTAVLVGLIIYLYLSPSGLVWLAILLMVAYVVISSGLTSLSWSYISELFPGHLRGFGSGLSSAISFSLLFISVKTTPGILYNAGEIVMYACFASVTLVTGIILSFILPETNGRSLQEIEDSLYDKKTNISNPT